MSIANRFSLEHLQYPTSISQIRNPSFRRVVDTLILPVRQNVYGAKGGKTLQTYRDRSSSYIIPYKAPRRQGYRGRGAGATVVAVVFAGFSQQHRKLKAPSSFPIFWPNPSILTLDISASSGGTSSGSKMENTFYWDEPRGQFLASNRDQP